MMTTPYSRHESFLAALSDSGITLPTPLTREELYLAKIAGENVSVPTSPYNRYETYLAKLAGEDVTVPTPVSRIEYYMYKACGYGNTAPVPASREEVFWARYAGYDAAGCGGGSATVTVDDAAAESVKALSFNINPVQAGSGDPSSGNIRAITGWQSATVTRTGRNIWGGSQMFSDMKRLMTGAETNETEGTVRSYANQGAGKAYAENMFKSDTRYSVIFTYETNRNNGFTNFVVRYMNNPAGRLTWSDVSENEKVSRMMLTRADDSVLNISKVNFEGRVKIYTKESGVFEGEMALSNYEEYKGTTYTFDLSAAGTVYGGRIDIHDGIPVLTVTNGEIDSYNNEELPGKWISDRDVYAAGTKPTVGAQVVYELDEDDYEQYQLPTVDIKTLSGVNNIWADCGPVSVTYIPDL